MKQPFDYTIPPTFNGLPLGGMVPIPRDSLPGLPQLWTWTLLWGPPDIPYTEETAQELARQGWQRFEHSSTQHTQLYISVRLTKGDKNNFEAWYQPTSHHPEPAPVALAFSIDSNPPPENVYMCNPLPVPQLGEYAFTENKDGNVTVYHIMQLPLEARQRWTALGDALRSLSAPLLWPPFTPRHKIASNELRYNRELQALQTQQQLAIGETKLQLMAQGAMLMAARQHLQELQEALRKADWIQQWEEIQKMVQQLASGYYEFHLQQTAPQPMPEIVQTPLPLGTGETLPAPAAEKQRKSRKPRTTKKVSTELVARRSPTVTIYSDVLNREIINALRDPTTYKLYEDQAIAEHKHRFDKEKGQIIIAIHPSEGEGIKEVLHAVNHLGDGCIDTHIAVLAIALDKNGAERIHTPFMIDPDEILEVCGKKKSKGSYTPLQRAQVIKHLKTLSQARVIATMPGRPPSGRGRRRNDGTVLRAEGALIDLLSFRIGEYHTITGEEVWEKRTIAIGRWATMIPDLSGKTAMMLRQVLAFSTKNERYQKRLGIYLTLMFRINAKRINAGYKGAFPNDISMSALLEGAGIVPPRQQGEFKDAIESALADLKKRNVIGDYWRVVEDTPEACQIDKDVQERARGWFTAYLQQKWNFSPPEYIKEQYRKISKPASKEDAGRE